MLFPIKLRDRLLSLIGSRVMEVCLTIGLNSPLILKGFGCYPFPSTRTKVLWR